MCLPQNGGEIAKAGNKGREEERLDKVCDTISCGSGLLPCSEHEILEEWGLKTYIRIHPLECPVQEYLLRKLSNSDRTRWRPADENFWDCILT